MKTDFSTTRYLWQAMLRYQIRTPNHQPLTSFPNVQEISANINWVKQTDWMLRGAPSWPESGSYWPVWVAGGDFLFWSTTHWCLWGRDLIYHDRDPRCGIYFFPRKCYLQYSGHGVQLDCGRSDEVAKKSVEDLLGSPNTLSCSPGVRCFVNPLKALITIFVIFSGGCGKVRLRWQPGLPWIHLSWQPLLWSRCSPRVLILTLWVLMTCTCWIDGAQYICVDQILALSWYSWLSTKGQTR